ncbi:MFS transporter [Primorskyibacter aestuariivivens]|uniref:MFS transporter n=1 Tax=Primorskyibacter aestuariivivens TaxID=1888912 RepID=UPI0023005135|nr:MFS transporter [Primorskyibacter aestuariivivens]MDA7429574.1 MFS transporter [Primorskyibacter aestuariivivens]
MIENGIGKTIMVASPIIGSVAFVLELTLVPLVLVSIKESLLLSTDDIAWVFNGYALAVAVTVLLGGYAGDHWGVKRVFLLGLSLFVIGAVVAARADDFAWMLTGRIIQGAGGGLFSPLVPVLLTRANPGRPGRILMIWGSIAGYVAAIAPLAGSSLLPQSDWRSVFVLLAGMAVIGLGMIFAKEPERQARGTTMAGNIRALLRSPALWLVFLYVFCTYGCIMFFLFSVPLRMAAIGMSSYATGLVLCAMWLSFAVVGTLLRNTVDGSLLRVITLVAPVFILLGIGLAHLVDAPVTFVLAAIAMGAGFACSNAPSTQLVMKFAPEASRGLASSVDITLARLGGVVSVAFLAEARAGDVVAFALALSLMAVVSAVIFGRTPGADHSVEG